MQLLLLTTVIISTNIKQLKEILDDASSISSYLLAACLKHTNSELSCSNYTLIKKLLKVQRFQQKKNKKYISRVLILDLV